MKIRLLKYFLCNSKMYFMSMCILTCEMFCLHRSSLSSFPHVRAIFNTVQIFILFMSLSHYKYCSFALTPHGYRVADT